jgi:hypothetical protein
MSRNKCPYKLYEISEKLEELNNLIDKIDGVDIPAELAEIFNDILTEAEQTKNDFADKIDDILCLIQSRKKWLQIRKEEADRLNKLIKKDENTIKFLNDYLLKHLEAQEISKLRTNKFNLTVANNGGKLPLWIDSKVNPKDLPKKYQNIIVEINKNAVRFALEQGEDLEFAGFSERGKHLRIS